MANLEGAAKGATTGAGLGATVGSVIPGVGTAIGAGVGGLIGGGIGLFSESEDDKRKRRMAEALAATEPRFTPGSFEQNAGAFRDPFAATRDHFARQAAGAQGRGAASTTAAQIAQGPQAQFRTQQGALADALLATAQGRGQSVAQQQLQQGLDRTRAGVASILASQRGMNPALAARQAVRGFADAAAQTSGNAALLRAQETLAAQQALGGVLAGARGQDIGLATNQAGFNQQANLANLQAQMQQREMNDRLQVQFEQMGLSKEQAQFQAQILGEQMRQEAFQRQQALAAALEQQRMASAARIAGAGLADQGDDFLSNLGGSLAKTGGEIALRQGINSGGGRTAAPSSAATGTSAGGAGVNLPGSFG